VRLGCRGHVAGKQDAQLGLGLQRAVGQLGVAGAEDQVWVAIDAELLLEGCLHVDLAQHAEPLAGELLADPGYRVGEAERGGRAQGVADISFGHAFSGFRLLCLRRLLALFGRAGRLCAVGCPGGSGSPALRR
jgi:hypothetical protein